MAKKRVAPEADIGKRYGSLVVNEVFRQESKTGWVRPMADCTCDCGGNLVTTVSNLRMGDTRSCGCRDGHLNADSHVGKQFGRLFVVMAFPGSLAGCRCDCGNNKLVSIDQLLSGHTRSCGCLRKELARVNATSHGWTNTPEWRAWRGMKQRCHNPKNREYFRYGARGITVCDEWQYSFEAFLAHVGQRPTPKHSLDRTDNGQGYKPGNVTWATDKQQARNTRRNVTITIGEETKLLEDWFAEINLSKTTYYRRIKQGMDPAMALTAPKLPGRRPNR